MPQHEFISSKRGVLSVFFVWRVSKIILSYEELRYLTELRSL